MSDFHTLKSDPEMGRGRLRYRPAEPGRSVRYDMDRPCQRHESTMDYTLSTARRRGLEANPRWIPTYGYERKDTEVPGRAVDRTYETDEHTKSGDAQKAT